MTRVPLVHRPVSLAEPAPSGSAGTTPRCQGCLPLLLPYRRSSCPQLLWVCCDRPTAVLFHHCTFPRRLVALDIGAPNLVRPGDRNTPQQVRIDLVLRARTAGVRARCNRRQPHAAHEALDALAVDLVAPATQLDHHASATVEWSSRVDLVEELTEQQVSAALRWRLPVSVRRRSRDTCQSTLAYDRNRIAGVDPALSDHGRLTPDFFFSQSSSIFRRPISL